MIVARKRLLAHAREFFDSLGGLYKWDDVRLSPEEPSPLLPDGKKPPLKFREKVVLNFDGWGLEVCAPEEEPPLGRIDLYRDGELLAGGPLDVQVWARIGSVLKEKKNGG